MTRDEVWSALEISLEREAVIEGAARYNGKHALVRTRGGVGVYIEVLTTAELLHLIDTGLEIIWSAEHEFEPLLMPYRTV